MKYIISLLSSVLLLVGCPQLSGQTRLYKRIAIVTNGVRKAMNDDAHYITFTDQGCYWSDKAGLILGGAFARYIKDENNLHCYSELLSDGNTASLFFSNDYSRINVRYNGGKTHVYVRELNGTTALYRKRNSTKTGNGSVSPPVIVNPVIGNGGRSSEPQSNKTTCLNCHGTGQCNQCLGKGYYLRQEGDVNVTCIICNGSGKCFVCHGRGYVFK
jgi:hypothetical protein